MTPVNIAPQKWRLEDSSPIGYFNDQVISCESTKKLLKSHIVFFELFRTTMPWSTVTIPRNRHLGRHARTRVGSVWVEIYLDKESNGKIRSRYINELVANPICLYQFRSFSQVGLNIKKKHWHHNLYDIVHIYKQTLLVWRSWACTTICLWVFALIYVFFTCKIRSEQ